MSPSMATKHISALEAAAGIRIFSRTTRRITLTELGHIYLKGVEELLADLDTLEDSLLEHNASAKGELRVTAPVSFGAREIAPLVISFQKKNPALIVELDLNDRVVNLVEEGWDLAIRIGKLPASSLIARRLAPCRMIVCASPSYLANYGTPQRLDDLKQHCCLCYTLAREGAGIWSFGKDGDITVAVSGSLRSNNGTAIVEAAIAGQGLTYQPSFLVAEAIAAGKLRVINLDVPDIELSINAVFASKDRLPIKVKAFLDDLSDRFSGQPPWDRLIFEATRP